MPTADLAVARVAERVRMGGHGVAEETIRRRYRMGLRNFLDLYRPLAATWRFYDNSLIGSPRLVATGRNGEVDAIVDGRTWRNVLSEAEHG